MFKAYEDKSSTHHRKFFLIFVLVLSVVMIVWWIKPSSTSLHETSLTREEESSSELSTTFITYKALLKIQKNNDIILGLLSVENLKQILESSNNMKNLPTYWIMAKQWICGLKKLRVDNFVLFVFVEDDSVKDLKKLIYSALTDIPVELINSGEELSIIPFTPKEIPQLITDYMEETKIASNDQDFAKFYKNFLDKFKEQGENVIPRELFTKHWEFVTLLKPIMVWKCVKHGFNVFFSDLDVVLFQNPTDFMKNYPDTRKFDIIFQIETCGTYESLSKDDIKINTGIYYVKSEPKSIQFLETWMVPIMLDMLTMFIPVDVSLMDGPNPNGRTEPTNDQAILNALVSKQKKKGNQDFVNSIGYLPVQKFPNKCQYTAIVGPEIDETGKNDMVLFHINGVWMSRQKLNYLKQREHFYLNGNNICVL